MLRGQRELHLLKCSKCPLSGNIFIVNTILTTNFEGFIFSVISFWRFSCFGHALLDPASPTWDWTTPPAVESESQPLNHQGSPSLKVFKFLFYAKCLACFVNSLRWKPAGLHRILRRNTRYCLIQPDFLNKWHSSGESFTRLSMGQVLECQPALPAGPWIYVYLNHLAVHLKTNTILSIKSNVKIFLN